MAMGRACVEHLTTDIVSRMISLKDNDAGMNDRQ
jgi:hypothetical protein